MTDLGWMEQQLVCSNCGSPRISPTSIQRGIGGGLIGLCHDCSPKKTIMPSETDASPKAVAKRSRILHEQATQKYRTVLTPLVERSQYRPRVKPVPADPMSLWDDTTTGV